jgi:RNA polymerase sigma-70 factor (ECF subfamily)
MKHSFEPTPEREGPASSSATPRSLLDRVRADEAAAWDRLVDLYAPWVYRWCRRFGLRDQEAGDIFQDVFFAVATHIRSFRKEKEGDTFRGWLRTIAENKVRDHFRRIGREPVGAGGTEAQLRLSNLAAADAADAVDASDEHADRALFSHALDLIRGEFESRTWQAFWLTTVEGASAKDAGLELNMSPGAVRVAKSRVLRRLREELGEL